jgi:hypothetical protein
LTQDQANRSKKAKVFFWRINMFELSDLDAPQGPSVHRDWLSLSARTPKRCSSAETRHIETSTKRDLTEIADGFQL